MQNNNNNSSNDNQADVRNAASERIKCLHTGSECSGCSERLWPLGEGYQRGADGEMTVAKVSLTAKPCQRRRLVTSVLGSEK